MKTLITKTLILGMLVVSVVVACYLLLSNPNVAQAIGGILRSGTDLSTMRTSAATTSPTYLNNGLSTTTLSFPSDALDSLTIMVMVNASSTNTNSPLNIQIQGSDNNIDWFDEDMTAKSATGYLAPTSTVALASTTVAFTYQPSIRTSTTTKMFDAAILPARFTRVIFSVSSTTPGNTSDGMAIWANIVGKSVSTTR